MPAGRTHAHTRARTYGGVGRDRESLCLCVLLYRPHLGRYAIPVFTKGAELFMGPDHEPRSITRLYGEQLRRHREQAGIPQAKAAEIAEVSQGTISRWEAGTSQPDFKGLRVLAKAYGAKPSELMPRNQYPSAPLDPEERLAFFNERNRRIQEMGRPS